MCRADRIANSRGDNDRHITGPSYRQRLVYSAPVRWLQAAPEYIGRQWRNFVPHLCQLIFAAILWVKLWEKFVTVIELKYALLVERQRSYGHFLKLQLIQVYLNKTIKWSSPFNSTRYVMLYPQNGDSVVTIDSVTSFHPMYTRVENWGSTIRCSQSSRDVDTREHWTRRETGSTRSRSVQFGSCAVNKL